MLSLTYGFRIEWAQRATVRDNRVWLLDHIFARSAMSIRATDSLVEGNEFGVWPFEVKPPIPGGEDGSDPPDPADPCIEPEDLYGNLAAVVAYLLNAWLTIITAPPEQPYRARGGLHLRGSSERIDVIRNRIDGGSSHGIVLGGTYPDEVDAEEDPETGGAPTPPTLTLEQTVVPGKRGGRSRGSGDRTGAVADQRNGRGRADPYLPFRPKANSSSPCRPEPTGLR